MEQATCSYAELDNYGAWLVCINPATTRLVPTADAGPSVASLPWRCDVHRDAHADRWRPLAQIGES